MRIERTYRLALFAVAIALVACGEVESEIEPIEAAPIVENVTPIVPPAPVVAPLPEPPPPPRPPPPDPEALAREREAAAQLRFEREYPLHGVAYHFLAQVHRRPDASSPVVGYMRRGAQLRAKSGLRGPGCARGWHEVPGGGFVCRGQGFALGDSPQTFDPSPVGAATGDALPYVYAWVARDDVPQYWRIPSVAEERAAMEWIRAERAREQRVASAAPASTPSAEAAEEPEPDLEAPPGLDGDASEENAEAPAAVASATADGGAPAQPSALRMRMKRGFYVSLDGLVTADDRRFYRTIRGGYVPADTLIEASPPAFRGVVLGGRWTLPLGFVFRGGVRTLVRDSARGVLELGDPVERTTPLPLSSETIERSGRRYRVSDRGVIVREDALRIATPIARPAGIPEGARWIHVDVAQQIVVAYEGDRPVFATLTSTGRQGFDTPTGTFRIQSKHVSTTMDDPDAGAEAYSIEDVPWTMYFEGSYAIHGAFWHDRFGHRRSHGCVNLAPADARWIFQWSEPALPPGWHGMSSRPREGTFVHVTSEAR